MNGKTKCSFAKKQKCELFAQLQTSPIRVVRKEEVPRGELLKFFVFWSLRRRDDGPRLKRRRCYVLYGSPRGTLFLVSCAPPLLQSPECRA